jgi:hypothetical protein
MNLRLKLGAMRSATTTSVRTRSAASVWAQNTIGRAMRQMLSGIWQSLTRSRQLIPGGLGDRHPHASALTGRIELFDARRLESDPAQSGVPRQRASNAGRLLCSLNQCDSPIFSRAKNRGTAWAKAPYSARCAEYRGDPSSPVLTAYRDRRQRACSLPNV